MNLRDLIRSFSLAAALVIGAGAFIGCDDKPKTMGDAAHDAKNDVKDAAHDAKNDVKDAAHDAKNDIKDATK